MRLSLSKASSLASSTYSVRVAVIRVKASVRAAQPSRLRPCRCQASATAERGSSGLIRKLSRRVYSTSRSIWSSRQRPSSSSILARAQQAATGGTESVFSGRLSVFALPDLLEFLRSGRRTGLLVCSSAAGLGRLRFRDGRITRDELVRNRRIASEIIASLPPLED